MLSARLLYGVTPKLRKLANIPQSSKYYFHYLFGGHVTSILNKKCAPEPKSAGRIHNMTSYLKRVSHRSIGENHLHLPIIMPLVPYYDFTGSVALTKDVNTVRESADILP